MKTPKRATPKYSLLYWTSLVNKECPGGLFIDWLLFKPPHNSLLFSTATATTLDNVQFFWAIDKKTKNGHEIRMARWWLIAATVFWLCSIYTVAVSINWNFKECCAFCHFNILMQHMYLIFSELFGHRILLLPKYMIGLPLWDTVSRKLAALNMLYSLKQNLSY